MNKEVFESVWRRTLGIGGADVGSRKEIGARGIDGRVESEELRSGDASCVGDRPAGITRLDEDRSASRCRRLGNWCSESVGDSREEESSDERIHN